VAEDNLVVDDEKAPLGTMLLRCRAAQDGLPVRYDLAMELRKIGWDDPTLVNEEEKDLFRFGVGRFSFSREHADCELLRKREGTKGL
jgi:hypothetical protein